MSYQNYYNNITAQRPQVQHQPQQRFMDTGPLSPMPNYPAQRPNVPGQPNAGVPPTPGQPVIPPGRRVRTFRAGHVPNPYAPYAGGMGGGFPGMPMMPGGNGYPYAFTQGVQPWWQQQFG